MFVFLAMERQRGGYRQRQAADRAAADAAGDRVHSVLAHYMATGVLFILAKGRRMPRASMRCALRVCV